MFRLELIRQKLIGLALTTFIAILIASGAGGYILYQTSITESAQRLVETAQSNARLIEVIAKHNKQHLGSHSSAARVYDSTVNQIKAAHEKFQFGTSGEFTLAKKEGQKIVFLMRKHLAGMDVPDPVSFDQGDMAEPMRRALSGESGSIFGKDYRGEYVMAAYEPVRILNLGIVAKIDMAEIRKPFIKTGLIIVTLSALVSLVVFTIYYRTSREISDRFEDSTQQFNRLAKNSTDMIYRMSLPEGQYEYVNPASIDLFGVTPEEFCNTPKIIQEIIHPAWYDYFEEQWGKLLSGDMPPTYEYQIITPSGEIKWITQRNVLITGDEGNPVAIEAIASDITEQKRMEKKIHESEQRLQTLLDTIPDLVWLKDPKGVYLSCNTSFLEFLDLSEVEIMGKTDYDLFEHHIADSYRKNDKIVLNTGKPRTNEEDAIYADGRVEQLETIKAPAYGPDGALVGVLGIGRNISARKQAEDRLRESEQRFTATFDQAAVGIARVGPDGQWLDVNKKLCEIVGYSREELLAKTFQDITYPEDLDGDLALVEQTLAGTRDAYAIDKRYIQRSGDLIWIRLTVSLVRNVSGAPLYFISVIEDINERKKANEKLREAAAVFSSTGEGVTITNRNGTILDVNDAFVRITGYSREEAVGENPRLLKSGRHDDKFYNDMWKQLLNTGHWHGEIWNRTKSGTVYPEILTISKVENENGEAEGYVGVFADISSLKETEARLDHMAHHDPLTDLPNRMLFRDRLTHSLAGAKRNGSKIAVIFLDLDHFKNINDTLGHSIGDVLLIQIARRMKILVRAGDTIGRISGDEFCLLFEDLTSVADAVPLVDKLLSVFFDSFAVNGQSLRMTASIGVAIYPDNSQDPDALLSFADAAMYEAKEAGRNTYRFYTKTLTEQALEYGFIQSAMREALEQSQFFLVYQPQMNLATKTLVGLEVLLRWQHPERGLIPPSEFIPVAEQSGMIRDLGAWILRSACAQGRAWMDEGLHFGRIFVNVAGPQIHDVGFVELVRDCLAETGLPAERLGLEVTESFVMRASGHAADVLLKVRGIGVELAIDDFGTGYSSLSYLKTLPIDKLKIDQSFVRDIPSDPDDMAIAEAVIAMGQALNMKVIAEGVEDEVQAEFLRSKGCEEAQGYLYARPLAPNELNDWMNLSSVLEDS